MYIYTRTLKPFGGVLHGGPLLRCAWKKNTTNKKKSNQKIANRRDHPQLFRSETIQNSESGDFVSWHHCIKHVSEGLADLSEALCKRGLQYKCTRRRGGRGKEEQEDSC